MPKLKINNRKQLVEYINKLGYVHLDELSNKPFCVPQSAIDAAVAKKQLFIVTTTYGREILFCKDYLQKHWHEMESKLI